MGLVGLVGLVLALFVADAIMAGDGKRTLKFGAGLAVCAVLAIALGDPPRLSSSSDCYVEWDMRASRTVCD
ncbi:hypothetical protein DES43_105202 [Aquamicrobium defluvii]|uniref:Uncharacterized protein n=1 Tax=Aquamicrobium defluvii TaxID=69279 RepID=A0A4R6YIA2_9HYPH|nr:hypothetical protein DES43_105202 [Aquamicrobium defluvii]